MLKRADVAQLVEHSLGKGEVTSSILVISSRDSVQGSGQCQLGCRQRRRIGLRPAENELNTDNFTGHCFGGSNSVVESQPSKLLVAGSIPVSRSRDRGQPATGLLFAGVTMSAGER